MGKDQDSAGVIKRFTKYLNGPMGKTVLENLDEEESFILQTSKHTLRVSKRKGKGVVETVAGIH